MVLMNSLKQEQETKEEDDRVVGENGTRLPEEVVDGTSKFKVGVFFIF